MNPRLVLRFAVLGMLPFAAACGENLFNPPTAPTGPSSLSEVLLPRVDGVWAGGFTLTGVAGGTGPARTAGALECVGAAYDAVVRQSNEHRLTMTRKGSEVTARLVSVDTGLACDYRGSVGANGSLVLDAPKCEAPTLMLRCHADPNGVELVRELELVGSSITATLDAPTNVTAISGVAAHTYNITDPNNDLAVGALVANHSFVNLTRR
jgi:hypothetical protein